jgi:hypothetical protein
MTKRQEPVTNLESSSDLSSWTPIWTNPTDSAGHLDFSEPSTARQRFYR